MWRAAAEHCLRQVRSIGIAVQGGLCRMPQHQGELLQCKSSSCCFPASWQFAQQGQPLSVGASPLQVRGKPKDRQPELQGRCSIVRELHVYGTAVAVHARDSSKQQHQVRHLALSEWHSAAVLGCTPETTWSSSAGRLVP